MLMGIPADIRWLIEAKVRLSCESTDGFTSFMPGLGKSTFAKRGEQKDFSVRHRCARWTSQHAMSLFGICVHKSGR